MLTSIDAPLQEEGACSVEHERLVALRVDLQKVDAHSGRDECIQRDGTELLLDL